MKRLIFALALLGLNAAFNAADAQAADPPTNPSLPGCWYPGPGGPSTMSPNTAGYILCDISHRLSLAGVTASTSGHSTAVPPTYTEGTDNPLSTDLSGNLRISGTINASSSAKATTADPSYTNNTDNPFSQNLSGHLRVIATQDAAAWDIRNITGTVTLPTGAATAAKQPAFGTAGVPSADVLTVQGIASMTALKVDGSAVTQPVSGTVTANAGSGTFVVSGTVTSNAGTGTFAVNTAQVAGTTTDTNSGVKSAGTQRIVIATDQPQLTNALKVDGSAVTQPVSGTVTANQGTNPWVANISQFGGTNVVTGIGASGAGIPRVTVSNDSTVGLVAGSAIIGKVAIDQTTPGTTNAVSVLGTVPVSGTVTANAGTGNFSENLAQVNGSTVVTAATGVQKVGVVGNAGAILDAAGANQSAPANEIITGCIYQLTPAAITAGNVSQCQIDAKGNTRTVTMDAAGNARGANVTAANALTVDGSAVTQPISGTITANAGTGTFGVNVAQIAGNTTLTGNGTTGTGSQRITVSSDNSAVAGFGVSATGAAVPANAVYGGSNVGGNNTGNIGCGSTAKYDASTSGSTQIVAISGSTTIYICGYTIFTPGTVNVKFVYGTGANCVTGPADITPAFQLTAQSGMVDGAAIFRGLKTIASQALCINASAAVAVQAIVYYTQF